MHITPQLTHREEFETLLRNYHMSKEAEQVLAHTPFVTMLALTSTGRNTIIRELLKSGHYYFIVSDTTRPPRYNDGVLEQNGVEYFFRTEKDMLEDIKQGQFLEAEVIFKQQVSGVSIREIKKAYDLKKIGITDVDLLGSLNIARLKPDTISIALLPPSFDEWMRRIHKRTKVSREELHRRADTALNILEALLRSDIHTLVVNDQFSEAVQTVDQVARFKNIDRTAQHSAREVARQLLLETRTFLAKTSATN